MGRRNVPLFGLFDPGIFGSGLSPKFGRFLNIGLLPNVFLSRVEAVPRDVNELFFLGCQPLRGGASSREDLSPNSFLPNDLLPCIGLPSRLYCLS